jgi:hypothetical protein
LRERGSAGERQQKNKLVHRSSSSRMTRLV